MDIIQNNIKNFNKEKLVFLIPEYNPKTPTHFAHLYDFISELRRTADIFLVIEKGGKPEDFKDRVSLQKFQFLPLRYLENFLILMSARLKGYKNFYIHYSFVSAFNASLLAKIFGGKVFYWNCGLPWNYQKGSRVVFEKLVYKMINFLVTGTEGMKREYARHYKIPLEKIKVMPNWINLENIKNLVSPLGGTGRQKVILFAHRLSRRKGAQFLPDILEKLKDENIVLIIIGGGPEEIVLKLKIKNLKLSERVRFLGWVPNEEIYRYYAAADVFIMPSEEEGFPRVLLEAMAMEVPFVSSDVGGVKEIIPPEFLNYVVEIGDVDRFSQKIKELLNLPQEKLEELKSIEKNWVQKYDISKVIGIFTDIIYNKKQS